MSSEKDESLAQPEPSEDDLWLDQEGVPTLDEPFLQKYLDGRDALVQNEKRQRSDFSFRQTLSPMAAEASAIVAAIRFEEQQTLWNAEFEDNLARQQPGDTGQVYPGMMFSLAKERMEGSKLWRIIKKMPKGALLHCHLGATGDIDELIHKAIATESMYIYAETALVNESARENADFRFQFDKRAAPKPNAPSIWSSEYVAWEPVPLAKAAASFPGGIEHFIHWFNSRVTITHTESISHHLGPNAVWKKFISTFRILAGLQLYEPLFRVFIRGMLKFLHEDGVRWVDIRTVFVDKYFREDAETPEEDASALLSVLDEEIKKFASSEEGKGFWGARLIWTTVRAMDTRRVVEDMKQCIEMKVKFPHLICGYDLVGQEDLGRSLAEITPELFWFRKKCMEAGVDIPFFFHAGETLGDGDTVDENLFDAVLLGTRRIGHGFSLYKHPLLIDMVKEKKILVESCPVSNEVLRLTGSIMSHPLPALLARGVACSLSNDDPAVLGQGKSGMTHDFWQALQGWENLGLEGLASLAENSVRWAAFEDMPTKEWQADVKSAGMGNGLRAQRIREWGLEFERFCQWVVLEYGAETDVNTLD